MRQRITQFAGTGNWLSKDESWINGDDGYRSKSTASEELMNRITDMFMYQRSREI